MSQEIIIAVIGGVVTVIVGLITAGATYFGVRIQIKKNEKTFEKKREQKENERKQIEQESLEYQKQIIERFIDFEVHDNFNNIKRNHAGIMITDTENLRNQLFNESGLNFTEFDKNKYDLIKYKSALINEVIEIYDAFRLLIIYDGVCINMPDDEFHRFEKGYQLCLNRYQKDYSHQVISFF
ncbi:hypothetical protein QPL77_12880 [Bacillus pumilus]|uniref:hypothetical protein n=1 Tax=Bacillus pumilus TaxID=1408 RepID=UPI002540DA9D|nr:hypothetical protein [Bacillus pumilus]WIG30895.1 hypothetical protein QPL77_12880 [Bacillus pumilus]